MSLLLICTLTTLWKKCNSCLKSFTGNVVFPIQEVWHQLDFAEQDFTHVFESKQAKDLAQNGKTPLIIIFIPDRSVFFFSVIFGFQLVVLKQQPFKCILALTCRGQGVWSFNRRGEKKAGESCQKKPVMLWSFLSAVSLAPLWVFTEVAAVAREKHTQKETSGSGSVLRFIQSVFFVVFATVTGLKGYSPLNQVCRPLT